MQHRVEESWRRNTAAVAERIDGLVLATGARALVVAGDAQSRSRLRDALSERSASIAVDVGSTAGGGSDEDVAAAVAEALADSGDASRQAALAQYEQAAGRNEGLAVAGLGPVLAALRAEQVETLLVDGGVERDAPVWFTDTPTLVALDAEVLRALGAEPHGPAPADAALVRAAAGCDAALVPLGDGADAAPTASPRSCATRSSAPRCPGRGRTGARRGRGPSAGGCRGAAPGAGACGSGARPGTPRRCTAPAPGPGTPPARR